MPASRHPLLRPESETANCHGQAKQAASTLLAVLIGALFWLWMLIEAATQEKKDSDKIVWVLIILFTSFIGALLYCFYRLPRRREEEYLARIRRRYSR